MSQNLVHYSHPQSRGMRTIALLKTFDIPHEYVEVDFPNKANKKDDYLQIHPLGLVPALKQNEEVILESGAITFHLIDLFGEKMNAPAPGTPERALIYQWVFFFQTTVEQAIMKGYVTGDLGSVSAEIKPLLQGMQSRLRGPFALGEEFSVLDVVLCVELGWHRLMNFYPEGLDVYDEYLARVNPLVKM